MRINNTGAGIPPENSELGARNSQLIRPKGEKYV